MRLTATPMRPIRGEQCPAALEPVAREAEGGHRSRVPRSACVGAKRERADANSRGIDEQHQVVAVVPLPVSRLVGVERQERELPRGGWVVAERAMTGIAEQVPIAVQEAA